MQQFGRFLVVIAGTLLFCSCEYAKPSKTTGDTEQQAKESPQADSPDVPKKPAYVVADPADTQDLTGINGGQRFTFDPPDYGGEWTQDNDSDLVRFYVVDESGSKNVKVAAESFCIKAGDNLLFSLDPDDGYDAAGSCSFSLEDRNLALAMNSQVEVIMQLAEKSYRATLNVRADSGSQSTVDQ